MLSHTEPAEAVFYNDDGAVHDQAEVECAEAHQVAGNLVFDHAGDRHQHRQRDHQRREDSRADVSEQQEQDHDNEECAFNQVFLDGRDRAVNEQGAVINSRQRHAFRQARPYGVDPCIDGLRDRPAVFADQHECRAKNNFFPVLGGRARAQLLTQFDGGNVSDTYRRSARVGDDYLAQVIKRCRLARYTH